MTTKTFAVLRALLLSGGMLLAGAASASINAFPSVLNFSAAPGQATAPQVLTVTNASGGPVTFNSMQFSPSGSIFAPQMSGTTCLFATVPNGGTCTVSLFTTPQPAGSYTAGFSMTTVEFGSVPVATATLNLLVGTSTTTTASTGALASVSPRQAPLASAGRSAVMLGYLFNGAAARPVAAYLCTQLAVNPPTGVATTNPCAPGASSPALAVDSSGFSAQAFGPTQSRATETISLPESVTRLSMAQARQTGDPSVYFVREFQGGSFAVVQLQAIGASLLEPLTLTDVRLAFRTGAGKQPTATLAPGEAAPPSVAELFYTGSGTLRGRWEVVEPGSVTPSPQDLVPEASVPFANRVQQRRFRLVERFEYALGPNGRFELPGPDPSRLPVRQSGNYLLLLRIEAVPARQPGGALVEHGAAAFSMPVLAYQVGTGLGSATALASRYIALAPARRTGSAPAIAWHSVPEARSWRIELANAQGVIVGSAFLRGHQSSYQLTPALAERTRGRATQWRVQAFDAGRRPIGRSDWQPLH